MQNEVSQGKGVFQNKMLKENKSSYIFSMQKNDIVSVIELRRNMIREQQLKLLPQNAPGYHTSVRAGIKLSYGTRTN